MSDELVKNLQKLCDEYEKQLCDIRIKIREIDTLPKAKALVGKYFKYSGGFGFFGAKKVKSYIYKHIVGVDTDCVLVDSFQIEKTGKIEVSYRQRDYADNFNQKYYQEITAKQYFDAYDKMIRLIKAQSKKRG